MTPALLRRAPGVPAAPVRLLHLGIGSFFRAHQAWFTATAPDASDWGYAAFAGRSSELVERLAAQDGVYTLVTRAPDRDRFDQVASVSATHAAGDHQAWLGYFRSPDLAAVTVTVTEAGYLRGPDGGLDLDAPDVVADVAALRADVAAPVRTAAGRLVAGMIARRRVDAGPLAIVPCDNLPDNGAVTRRVLLDLAGALDPALPDRLDGVMSVVSTTVDRITPRPTDEDVAAVLRATGARDRAPVVTEPFAEWVLCGEFPAGRPDWAAAGATVTDDIRPFEQRKLWLLNGGHSLLAYAGLLRDRGNVAEAVADDDCRGWLGQWWELAARWLDQPEHVVRNYRSALLDRFANPRIDHRLAQIATDGSQKLPIRVLPVLRAERDAGRSPEAATRILAAWIACLRSPGVTIEDVRRDALAGLADGPPTEAVQGLLDSLGPGLGEDRDLVAAVADQVDELTPSG